MTICSSVRRVTWCRGLTPAPCLAALEITTGTPLARSCRAQAQRCDLRSNRLAMVDDLMGAEILDPPHRLGARGCCHYGEIGERADELDRDRADAASAADDENRGGRARHRLADVHAVEQGFPCGDRCERQRRGLGKSERARLVPDNALVDEMKLSVGARTDVATRIED